MKIGEQGPKIICITVFIIGLTSFLLSLFPIQYMSMWYIQIQYEIIPSRYMYQIYGFGYAGYAGSFGTQALPLNILGVLPGIFILLGIIMVGFGLKSSVVGIIGGMLMIFGPIFFIVSLASLNLAWQAPRNATFLGLFPFFTEEGMNPIIPGEFSSSFAHFSWSLGFGTYLPLVCGIIGLCGSIWQGIINKATRQKLHELPAVEFFDRKNLCSREQMDKLRQVVKVSKSLPISRMAKVLEMDEDVLWKEIFRLAEQFGFTIENDTVIFAQGNTDAFIDELDKHFSDWEKKTTSKIGKI